MNASELTPVEIHRAEVSGVPTWWADVPGETQAALLFRVGRVDEAPPEAGLSHLVEHLALYPLGRPAHPINGLVDDTRTIFYSTGTPSEIAWFLERVAASLSDLDLERLEDERRILLTESEQMPAPSTHSRLRFGITGYGMGSLKELGLHSLGPERIREWCAERFNRANAALWITGPPPEGLVLDLPDGERFRPPAPQPLPELELPAYLSDTGPGVSLAWTGERSTAVSVATSLVQTMAEQRLRRRQGISYSVASSYGWLGGHTAHSIVYADCLPAHAGAVRDELLGVYDELATSGPPAEELDRLKGIARRTCADPFQVAASLDAACTDELFGGTPITPDELVSDVEGQTAEAIATALADAAGSLILQLPSGVGVDRSRFHLYAENWDDVAVEGKAFHQSGPLDRLRGRRDGLVIGPEGVSYLDRAGDAVTVRFDRCVVVTVEGDGLRLHDDRGTWVFARFENEAEASEITKLVRAGVPEERWVHTERGYEERLAAASELCRRAIGSIAPLKLHLSVLAKLVLDGEPLREAAVIRFPESEVDVLLVATGARVIGVTGNEADTFQFPYESIAEVSVEGRLRKRSVVLQVAGERLELAVRSGSAIALEQAISTRPPAEPPPSAHPPERAEPAAAAAQSH